MPNISEKKIKLLTLLRIFLEKTDDGHSLTLPQILHELEACGITAERKSIYDDIETLRSFGVEIEKRKTRTFEYFLKNRRFSLQELKQLTDAVQCAPFLSKKKASELTAKLATLCSAYQATALKREVLVPGRARPLGEKAADLDLLHTAISEGRKIKFLPMEWRLSTAGKPERAVRKGGKAQIVSPWRLLWNGEWYQLAVYDGEAEKAKLIRVDQMASLEIMAEPAEGGGAVAALLSEESAGGEKLTLEFAPALLEQMVERFGTDFVAEPSGKNKLRITVRAALAPEFFSWLYSLGTDAKLVSPKKAAEQFRERTKATAKFYKS